MPARAQKFTLPRAVFALYWANRSMKADHWWDGTERTGPRRSLESRTWMVVAACATSTQLPPSGPL